MEADAQIPGPGWEFADAWVLTAVAFFGRRGCTLALLIAEADAISHDIPLEEDAARSIGKLVVSGLITFDEGRFRITSTAKALYRKRDREMFKQTSSMLDLLQGQEAIDGYWSFKPGEFQAAYEDYSPHGGG